MTFFSSLGEGNYCLVHSVQISHKVLRARLVGNVPDWRGRSGRGDPKPDLTAIARAMGYIAADPAVLPSAVNQAVAPAVAAGPAGPARRQPHPSEPVMRSGSFYGSTRTSPAPPAADAAVPPGPPPAAGAAVASRRPPTPPPPPCRSPVAPHVTLPPHPGRLAEPRGPEAPASTMQGQAALIRYIARRLYVLGSSLHAKT